MPEIFRSLMTMKFVSTPDGRFYGPFATYAEAQAYCGPGDEVRLLLAPLSSADRMILQNLRADPAVLDQGESDEYLLEAHREWNHSDKSMSFVEWL